MSASRVETMWERLAYDRRIVGDASEPGRRILRRTRLTTVLAVVLANVGGAAVVACFALWALPTPEGVPDSARWVNTAIAGGYLLAALLVGVVFGLRRVERRPYDVRDWLCADRAPTADQRDAALRAPLRITFVQAVLWLGAVLVFTLVNATYDWLLGLGVGLTVALGGMTTSAAAYLLAEFAQRPLAARALAAAPPEDRRGAGVAVRWMLVWALGSGIPFVAFVLIGIVALTPVSMDETTLAVTMLALGAIGLGIGAFLSLLVVLATVHPIGSIRRGLARVRAGDFDVDVPVWDSTEVGLLQAGFNEMAGGLRERERIRDVFGRQVGEDVARKALSEEVRLGGETRETAVLFVDIVGSTELAAERPPEEVVELLNRFFAEVVDVVEAAGGWVNKFEGDAALAVFGAPLPVEDAAGRALRAARKLDERLHERVPELEAGIGVASGEAVAGNIGAESRFEYTVIGDPVNEAARLTELAKDRDVRVLASQATVERAGGDERDRWSLGEEVTLRGRSEPTRLACPRRAG
jgi:adenylate cyclase